VSRGYQVDTIAECAALVEVAATVRAWAVAEAAARKQAAIALRQGARSAEVAKACGMSRTTLYRWIEL